MAEENQGTPVPSDPQMMSYEEAKAELRTIVQALESGSIPLEDTLELWQRGEQLATRCKAILDRASALIESSQTSEIPSPAE